MKVDVAIINGRIIDGTEKPRFRGDLYIKDGTIVSIGQSAQEYEPREVIDATGRIVCPGFIDSHVHSDLILLWDRQHASGLQQGVTTEILGQDGLSYAPLSGANLAMTVKYLAGLNGNPDLVLDWSSVQEYRAKFDRSVAINTAYQAPHGALRLETVGAGHVPLKGAMLTQAKALLDQSLKQGAVGFSTGLSYFPAAYSDTAELVQLCKTVAENDSIYVTHNRTVFFEKRFDPVLEAIEIARRSGCRLHFSHFRTSPATAGRVAEKMAPIEAALAEGIDITLELYPYPTGSGPAIVFLPPFVAEGGFEATMQRLADRTLRKRIVQGIEDNMLVCQGTFSHLPKNAQYVGRDFSDVAAERGQTVPDLLCDLLFEEELEVGFYSIPAESEEILEQLNRDMLELLSRPYYMVGSDGIPVGKMPHPRAFGTFPRLLRFCREYGFSLEKMINRMTNTPAQRFGLKGRGKLAVGSFADLVVFDPETVNDTATYRVPRSAPQGIDYVLVNGEVALRKGKVTGIFAGRAVAREQ